MKNKDKIILSMLAMLAFAPISTTSAATNTNDTIEKCYGIVKAGLNDCQTAAESCAGSSKQDRQSDAFIFLPKGTCEKIVNSHLTIKSESQNQ